MRRALILLLLCGALGCAAKPLPPVVAPVASTRVDSVPAPPLSTLVIPLQVPRELVSQLIREQLTLPGEPDYRTVTGDGESPELGVRYQAELDAPTLASEGRTLHVGLPVRYWGAFRARAKTPFGWIWLTKSTHWGSREQPGQIALTVSTTFDVDDAWQLRAHASLSRVELRAPDVSKLCAGKVFKVCVPVELVRDRVHRELEAQLRARAEPALARLDALVAARANLPALAASVWQQLQSGLANDGETLLLAPEGMALGEPRVSGDDLQVELRIWGRPRWTHEGPPPATPQPPPRELGPAQSELHFDVSRSFTALGAALTAALTPASEGTRVTAVQLLGAAESAQRYLLAATLIDEGREATVYFEATLLLEGTRLGLGDLQPTSGSQLVLQALGDPAALTAQLSQLRCPLDDALDARLRAVRALLAGSVGPLPSSPLPGAQSTLQAAYATPEGITFSAVAR